MPSVVGSSLMFHSPSFSSKNRCLRSSRLSSSGLQSIHWQANSHLASGRDAKVLPSVSGSQRKNTPLIACSARDTNSVSPSNEKHRKNLFVTSCKELVPCFRSSSKYQAWGMVSKEWMNQCTHNSCGYPRLFHCSSQVLRWSRGSEVPWYLCLLRGPFSSLNRALKASATQLHRDRVLR